MADSRHKTVASPEYRYERKCRMSEKHLQSMCEEEKKKTARHQRQIDRQMLLTRQELVDIKARTPSPCRHPRGSARVPDIAVDSVDAPSFRSSHGSLHIYSSDEEADVDLLGPKTKRNLALSKKLSKSLEVMSQKREQSPQRCNGQACRVVSPRAVDELQKAAQVLKNTKHDADVQKLLASVSASSSNHY